MHIEYQLKSAMIPNDGLRGQVEAEIGWIILPKLLLIQQFVLAHLIHLRILRVLLPSALQLRIEGVVALRVALMAIVGRDLIVALLLSLLLEGYLVFPHFPLRIVILLQLRLRRVVIDWIIAALVGLAVGFGQLFLLQMGIVWFGEKVDELRAVVIVAIVLLVGLLTYFLRKMAVCFIALWNNGAALLQSLFRFAVSQGFKLFIRNFPALLIVGLLLMVAHIQRLIVPPCKFFLRFEFVFDRLVHPRPTSCPLNIDCIQVPHVCLILRNPIFVRIPFRRLEYAGGCDF